MATQSTLALTTQTCPMEINGVSMTLSGLVAAFRYAVTGWFIRYNRSGLTAEPGDKAEFRPEHAGSQGSNHV